MLASIATDIILHRAHPKSDHPSNAQQDVTDKPCEHQPAESSSTPNIHPPTKNIV